MTLGATLYLRNSVDAVNFYQEAFGMTVGYNARHADGSFLHAELEKDGKSIFAVSESMDASIAKAMLNADLPTMSYGLEFETVSEVEKAFAMLSEGGHVIRPLGPLPWSDCSADVVDQYGVYWYVTVPNHRPADG